MQHKSQLNSNYASAPMCYIHITSHVMTMNLYIYISDIYAVYISQLCIYVVIILLCQARDSLISIAIAFPYCLYTPKALSIELVSVIRMILCSYI